MSIFHTLSVVVLCTACVAACQSEKAGVQMVCDAPQKAGIDDLDPAKRSAAVAEYLSLNVDNRKAIDLYIALTTMAPPERTVFLAESAQRLGIENCPLVDEWKRVEAEQREDLRDTTDQSPP